MLSYFQNMMLYSVDMSLKILIMENHVYLNCLSYLRFILKIGLRWLGVEPGSTAWKAAMLTAIPTTLDI